MTPSSPSLAKGTALQLTATGTYSDQTLAEITAQVSWASSSNTVVTVSTGGLATAVEPGMIDVTASLDGVSAKTTLRVTPATLASIAITPPNPSIRKGTTQLFSAIGTFTDSSTQDLTAQVSWSSSDIAVATMDNQGLATGLKSGTSTIAASWGGKSGSTTLTVVGLMSISVTPANPSIANGTTQQFTATGTYTDSSTQNLTPLVTWSSSIQSLATVSNATGSQGLASGVGVGSPTISATLEGITGSTTLTVTSATLVSISVTPANPSIPKGTTQQFTATGTFSDSTTQNITAPVTWSSSVQAFATISNAAGSQGLATGTGVGAPTISATLAGKTGSTTLTVMPAVLVSISITPANPTPAKGTTQQFTATGTYTDSSAQNITSMVTWASSQPKVATISNTAGSQGLGTATGSGSATISATLAGKTGSTTLTVPWPGFLTRTLYAAGDFPEYVAIGDFNVDGKLDLVATNDFRNNVSLLLGDGTGKFGTPTNLTAGTGPEFVAVGDFNNDGKPDLAVTNRASNNVSVLLGDGTGKFGTATNFGLATTPKSVAIGDFNGDGKIDLVTANSSNVSVLLGDGTGKFGPPTNITVGSGPTFAGVADFNKDGKADLVVSNYYDNNVSVLLGDGTGKFGTASNFSVSRGPDEIAMGDFNGDAKLDLAVASQQSSNISVLLGDGTGKFGTAANFVVNDKTWSVAVMDCNGDGKLDIAAPHPTASNTVSVLLGDGTGKFGTALTFGAGGLPVSVAGGDFNGDGRPDLVIGHGGDVNVAVLLNQ